VSVKRLGGVLAPVVAATVAGVLASAAPAAAAPVRPNAPAGTSAPQLMAHKGLHYPYSSMPENSVGAIEAAAGLGVPSEIDILLSKPVKSHPYGVPFVFHDQTLDRMTKLSGYVSDYPPNQLSRACLVTRPGRSTCSSYMIPRLLGMLQKAQAANGQLDIEIKNQTLTWNQALVIVKRLELGHVWDWDILPGFKYPLILSQWAQPLAELRAVAAYRGDPPLVTEFLSVKPDYSKANTKGMVMEAVNFRNATADVVSQLHAMGLKVDVYTTNKSTDWDVFATAGVDWVISDNVKKYLAWAAG
jgi:glycerophosphoryl diester phosphodiesterase